MAGLNGRIKQLEKKAPVSSPRDAINARRMELWSFILDGAYDGAEVDPRAFLTRRM